MTQTYPAAAAAASTRSGRPRRHLTRDQFLDAAVSLFGRQGVAATTLAHIAKDVGVTTAMVHYHFANREQLLDAVAAERIQPFIDALHAPITPKALHDPVAILHAMAQCMLDHVLRMPWLAPTWLSDIGSTSGELCQRVLPYVPMARVNQLTAAIAAAQARGEIDSRLLPHMIFTSIAGLVLLPFASVDPCNELHPDADFSTDALRHHVISTVDNLLRPKP